MPLVIEKTQCNTAEVNAQVALTSNLSNDIECDVNQVFTQNSDMFCDTQKERITQLLTNIIESKENHQSALFSRTKMENCREALQHFIQLKNLSQEHHHHRFDASINNHSNGSTLTLSIFDQKNQSCVELNLDYNNLLDEDVSDLCFDTTKATPQTKILLESFNRSIRSSSTSEPVFMLDEINLSGIGGNNRHQLSISQLDISGIQVGVQNVNLSSLNLSNINSQSSLEALQIHDDAIFNLQRALGDFKGNERSVFYLRDALSSLNENENSVNDLNQALNKLEESDDSIFSLTQALAKLDNDGSVVFNLKAAMDQLDPTNISIIELDNKLSQMTAFNAHMAPGDMLMSTKRPSGNIEQYAQFLKEQEIGTLISIGANESKTLPATLAKSGINHINDTQFHIDDFLGDGELPASKLKDITDKINALEEQGIKVAIHCGAGDGRSGVVKSAYVLSKQMSNLASTVTDTINTHYHGTKTLTVSKVVCDAVRSVRAQGHELAVERPEDVNALQTFYLSLVSSQ
ncbi:dual specificity protein phosphatase family protein [Shewanella surugensis]|uniref:Dual specificity protein phosphatase family protein n=1 Tax=Shewanella surugensis TaxID=212020 RepID=A0ABT0LFX0_9GAMM|nr:dual specificity protein phosphatase family protein [Shewanella surugensis]MCL1126584.1 dual specificity protein phosphatase family protein [Shewanella surugensis]